MNYVKYLFCIAALSSLPLTGMESEITFNSSNTSQSNEAILAALIPNLIHTNNTIQQPLTAFAPLVSHDFNPPVEELSIVQNLNVSAKTSPATTPLKAFYSNASHNFQTMIRKKLFAATADDHVNTQAITRPAFESNNEAYSESVVIPWTQSTKVKKSKSYHAAMTVITSKPTVFVGAEPESRKRKKAKTNQNLPVSQPQENITSSNSGQPVNKELIPVNKHHRKARPQNDSIFQFKFAEFGNTPAKKKRSRGFGHN